MRLRFARAALWAAELADRAVSYMTGSILLAAFIFTVLSIADISAFNARGMETVTVRDPAELIKINPDTVAWITMDGTRIDHPVVQGRDNFEYLDLDLHRNFYAGGSIFLDQGNSRDLSDSYDLIHGHHMSEGAMFGDLDRYLDEDFLNMNHTGTLTTPDRSFSIEAVSSGTADAYDTGIYNVGCSTDEHIDAIVKASKHKRRGMNVRNAFREAAGILVLSTCTGEMDDSRTAVFCVMREIEEKKGDSDE